MQSTARTWQHWSDLIGYQGRWRDLVLRSALLLKALTLKSTGAIAAAATTSLPGQLGGKRNFDYRFAWIRDASFALDAMSRLGLPEELHAGVTWLLDAVAAEVPALRVLYGLGGDTVSAEMTEVANVPGYRGSLPVHVGNAAAGQSQLGAYGDLLDAVWRYVKHGGELPSRTGTMLAEMIDHLCDIWESADAGIWELGTPEHDTSSKVSRWVAMDRAVRLADAGEITSSHVARWQTERRHIRDYIEERCWSEVKHAYSFYAGSDQLDAAVLLEAEQRFTDFIAHANDVGLFSEEFDPATAEPRGNLPPALTHLAIIGAATALD